MRHPWSHQDQDDGSIEIRYDGELRYTLRRANGNGFWEVRRAGEEEVIFDDQYRHDIFSGIQSGRIA